MSYREILALFAFISAIATGPTDAAGLGGTLQGSVTQDAPRSTYEVEMELHGNRGSVNYPSLGCGGRLKFVRSDGKAYWYRETITAGKEKCINGGSTRMSRHPTEKNAWNWRWQGSGVTVRGVLHGAAVPDSR